jgi:hypothetical protein
MEAGQVSSVGASILEGHGYTITTQPPILRIRTTHGGHLFVVALFRSKELGATARLAATPNSHTGDFLEDDFCQEWATTLAEELRATHIALLRGLAARLRAAGDTDAVVRTPCAYSNQIHTMNRPTSSSSKPCLTPDASAKHTTTTTPAECKRSASYHTHCHT